MGSDVRSPLQAAYASQFLYVTTLHLTKAVTANFTASFAPVRWVGHATSGIIFAHLAWTLVSMFVIAFQCHVPEPWQFYGNTWHPRVSVGIGARIVIVGGEIPGCTFGRADGRDREHRRSQTKIGLVVRHRVR